MSFLHTSQTCIGSYEPCKSPWNPKIWAIAYENGHKTRKLWVFGPNSQTCIGSLKPRKSPRNSANCGQYLMKTTIKRENDEFLVITLKHVSGLTSHANRPGTRKIWAIAHENGHKTRKLQVFGPNSQTCIGSLKPRKSPRNSENCGQ